jgi:RimJ/RimL family protein N-acetyltransferase
VLRPDYPIRTERLVLRPFTEADLEDVLSYQSDPEVVRFLLYGVRDAAEVRAWLRERAAETELTDEGQTLALGVEWPAAGRLIGQVNLRWRSRESRQGEVGYTFNSAFHGKGLATEAVTAVLRLGFEGLGLHRVYGECDALNRPSAALMERLGMRREAHFKGDFWFKGRWSDSLIYGMLEDEWADRVAVRAGTVPA